MDANELQKLLHSLAACGEAKEWCEGKGLETAWATCNRGDWMLWLYARSDHDGKKISRAKAECANLVRHLMKDERSTSAVDAAIAYSNGEITRNELASAAYAAYAAYVASRVADDVAYAAAKEVGLNKCASICREYLNTPTFNLQTA